MQKEQMMMQHKWENLAEEWKLSEEMVLTFLLTHWYSGNAPNNADGNIPVCELYIQTQWLDWLGILVLFSAAVTEPAGWHLDEIMT